MTLEVFEQIIKNPDAVIFQIYLLIDSEETD